MKPSRKQLCDAACAGDLELLRKLAEQGAKLNEISPIGESFLEEIVFDLCVNQYPYRYEVVKTLLELGADPNVLGEEKSSPLESAMLRMDTEMLRVLLEGGARPNEAGGFHEEDSFYDWAEFDYRYTVFDLHEIEIATEDDRKDEESWLLYLDRMAIKYGMRRPGHLFLLRQYGARTIEELKRENE